MSLWMRRTEKTGQHWWLIDVPPTLVLVALGIIAALLLPLLSQPCGHYAHRIR